jgi:GTP:adenosylcobinamide-phosphate guanylyltransferase
MDAIIIAGGIPQPEEPLYQYTLGTSKSLLGIAGKPMVQWVVDALCGAETIDQIIIAGLTPDSGVTCKKICAYIPNQGEMLANIRAGMNKEEEINPQGEYVLFVSADIPSITSTMVDWTVKTAMETEHDLYYNVIERKVMEKRFPTSKRTYLRLKDVEVCGGDMNVLRVMTGSDKDELWKRLINSRKSVIKQASLIGWDTLFLVLTHQVTLEQAVHKVSKRLNLRGRAVLCPFAEIGMDIDKPFQFDIIRKDLMEKTDGS